MIKIDIKQVVDIHTELIKEFGGLSELKIMKKCIFLKENKN